MSLVPPPRASGFPTPPPGASVTPGKHRSPASSPLFGWPCRRSCYPHPVRWYGRLRTAMPVWRKPTGVVRLRSSPIRIPVSRWPVRRESITSRAPPGAVPDDWYALIVRNKRARAFAAERRTRREAEEDADAVFRKAINRPPHRVARRESPARPAAETLMQEVNPSGQGAVSHSRLRHRPHIHRPCRSLSKGRAPT